MRGAMEEFIASSGEMRRRDRQMVRKVADLKNTVKAMEEEEGRKVTLDEAAQRLADQPAGGRTDLEADIGRRSIGKTNSCPCVFGMNEL